jgi:transposase
MAIVLTSALHVRRNYDDSNAFGDGVPSKKDTRDAKAAALLEEGTLNPFPEKVSDPKFQEGEFFDPRDVVQVKYEMLRRVLVDNASVTDTTSEYGVSRPTYYQARTSFDEAGIAGLVPRKRGPRGPHKLQGEVLAFVEKRHVPGEPIRARELAKLIRDEFSIEVHPRTIERALAGKKTTPRRRPPPPSAARRRPP